MFYDPCFPGPPQKRPPPKFPPPVCKIWRFLGPPPDPPFLRVWPRTPWSMVLAPWPSWCFLILWFDLWWWSSIINIIIDDVIVINFIYNYYRSLSMHQGDPSCMRLHASSSRVLLQKNTFTITHHHGKIILITPPYSPIIHYCPGYRVYLPFYRVKNPISPSLS